MSTKLNPGKYDCFSKLAADEPYFVLRAKDPVAPRVIEEWVQQRTALGQDSNPKLKEALDVGVEMMTWRARNMCAQTCGCDPGTTPPHFCDGHSQPQLAALRDTITKERKKFHLVVNDMIAFAAQLAANIGEISVPQAIEALREKIGARK